MTQPSLAEKLDQLATLARRVDACVTHWQAMRVRVSAEADAGDAFAIERLAELDRDCVDGHAVILKIRTVLDAHGGQGTARYEQKSN